MDENNIKDENIKNEKDIFLWKQGITLRSGQTATIKLIEKKDNFERTVIIEDGKIIQKPDDVDILGIYTPFGFEVRGLKRKM